MVSKDRPVQRALQASKVLQVTEGSLVQLVKSENGVHLVYRVQMVNVD